MGEGAMVADKARAIYEKQAKDRQRLGGKKGGESKGRADMPEPSSEQRARDAAGKAAGVSGREGPKVV